MRVAWFCHSLVSDWNHGNAHFLRGVVSELLRQGHEVQVYEPGNGWSFRNLVESHGLPAASGFKTAYPTLTSTTYSSETLDLGNLLNRVDLVVVHEWTDPEVISRIGTHHKTHPAYTLLFHDTHHRAASASHEMALLDLSGYDGILAFGNVIRDTYIARGWARQAFTWHEAADTHVFSPRTSSTLEGDLVWIGNWGDNERNAELREFLIQPVAELQLKAVIYGVRFPEEAQTELRHAGIDYRGWLPNYQAPDIYARYSMTVHVPRRPYSAALPGVPTIRVFEALACGIPLISAPWSDSERLFEPGRDFLVARDGNEMRQHMSDVLHQPALSRSLADHGRNTILAHHTCTHRVKELLAIVQQIAPALCAGVTRS